MITIVPSALERMYIYIGTCITPTSPAHLARGRKQGHVYICY